MPPSHTDLAFWSLTGIRAQKAHRKSHSINFFGWLWEKLSGLLQGLRKMLRKLTESLVFEVFIFLVVCLNTIMLVAQTFAEVEIRGGKSWEDLFMWRRFLILST